MENKTIKKTDPDTNKINLLFYDQCDSLKVYSNIFMRLFHPQN